MRLVDTSTVQLHEFFGAKIPPYAILSHRWEDGEISFKDVTKSRNLEAPGWAKVRASCELAKLRGHQWIWIDTCCIDRRSSAELSEAINSMFAWYMNSTECYAFLIDLPPSADPETTKRAFRSSEWFVRGWTLQELIAPANLLFLDQAWTPVGTKESLCEELSGITGIAEDALRDRRRHKVRAWNSISAVSIATRMSWASHRVCTREEDMAYCLLGIFGINMPLLYGEGSRRAFRRLQLEIMKSSDDESIFAWYSNGELSSAEKSILMHYRYGDLSSTDEPALPEILQREGLGLNRYELLAPSPAYFHRSSSIKCQKFRQKFKRLPYTVTNKGLQFSVEKRFLDIGFLTVCDNTDEIPRRVYEVPLNCFDADRGTQFCLHISQWGSLTDFRFDQSGVKLHRLHATRYETSPEAVVFSRPSITQSLFEGTSKVRNAEMQIFYLRI